MRDHRKYLEEASEADKGIDCLKPELIGFYKSVYDFQLTYYHHFKEHPFEPSFVRYDNYPVILSEAIKLPSEVNHVLLRGLRDLVALVERHNQGMDFQPLVEAVSSGRYTGEGIARSLLSLRREEIEELAVYCRRGADECLFVLINWVKPLFVLLEEQFAGRIVDEDWIKPRCPFCGYHPDMAKIVEPREGKKYLHCALCEHEWSFKRISCTICGNEKAETMGYLTAGGKDPYRIEYCDQCRGYIKTRRISKVQDPAHFDLLVENLLTTSLDSSALEQGYLRP